MTFWCGSGSAGPCLWLIKPDSDPDPAIFVINTQDTNKKLNLNKKFFCLLLFEGTFTSFIKDKKSKRSHKKVKARFFSLFLLDDRRIRIREAQKHVDPVDPDPGHWKRKCLERLGHRHCPHSAYSEEITFAADQPGPDPMTLSRFLGFFKNRKFLGI